MSGSAESGSAFFHTSLRGLEGELDGLCRDFSPEAGFATFLLRGPVTSLGKWPPSVHQPNPSSSWSALRRQDFTSALATAGYFLALKLLPPDAEEQWKTGFWRLAQRDPFPPDRESFVYRPTELLGVCLGVGSCLEPGSADRQWLHQTFGTLGRRVEPHQPWDYLCSLLAADSLGAAADWTPLSMRSASRWTLDELALALVAVKMNKSNLAFEGFSHDSAGELQTQILDGFFSYDPSIVDGAKKAAIYWAVRRSYQELMTQKLDANMQAQQNTGTKVFIGHGRSPLWRELKEFVTDRLKLPCQEFNSEAVAGLTTAERLEDMLDDACFAFLVFTAEDEHHDNTKHARENVIHEQGLFQGKLGRRKAIVLLEHGCSEFSNIVGQSQIRFPSNNIKASFEEVRQVLEREKLVKP
jgi:predicted nucleotide-binding protein